MSRNARERFPVVNLSATVARPKRRRRGVVVALALALTGSSVRANDVLWSSAGGSAWLTGSNWTGGNVPSLNDNAQFGNNPTGIAAGAGINFSNTTNAGTQTNGQRIQDVGAIELTSARTGANPIIIGNSSMTSGASGTLRLLGTTVNGASNVILRLNNSQALTLQDIQGNGTQTMAVSLANATSNNVVIDGSGVLTISTVIQSSSGTTPLAIGGAGTGRFEVTHASNTFTGPITISGSEARFAADGSFGNASNSITVDGGRLATVSGNTFTLGAGRSVFLGQTAGTAISVVSSGTLMYNGVLANKAGAAGTLVKQGAGILSLGGVSTYTGDTTINNGTVTLTTGSNRLPTGTTIAFGQSGSTTLGTLNLNGRSQEIAGLNSILGTSTSATNNNTVTSTAAATLTLGGSGTYSFGRADFNTESGVIMGAISLVKQGTGVQTLGDSNTYTGTTTISGGRLQFAKSVSLYGGADVKWTADNITVAAGGTLGLNVGGSGEFTVSHVGFIAAIGTETTGFTSGSTLGLDTSNAIGANFVYDVAIANPNNNVNALGLTKLGANTLTLSENSSYTGKTTVAGGTLALTSASVRNPIATSPVIQLSDAGSELKVTGITTAGGFALANGQTLTGIGSVDGSLEVGAGATISPGNGGVGELNTDGQSWQGGGKYVWEIGSTDGSVADLLTLNGKLTLGAAPGNKFVIQIVRAAGFTGSLDPSQWFTIAHATTMDAVVLDAFVLADPDGGAAWEAERFASAGGFDLRVSPTPEPGSFAMLATAALHVLARRPRRRNGDADHVLTADRAATC